MKLTRLLTKRLIGFWGWSLLAVMAVILLGAVLSFMHISARFQLQQVDELQTVLQQRDAHEHYQWLPAILSAYGAEKFELLEQGQVIYRFDNGAATPSAKTYRRQLSSQPLRQMMLVLPTPYRLTLPDTTELVILLTACVVILLFIFYGYRWIRHQMDGIEALAYRSQLILAGELQDALKAPGNGQPKIINGALTQLLTDLADARRERARFDQFIRSNTFLDPQTRVGNRLFLTNRLEALSYQQQMITSGVMYLLEMEDLELYKQSSGMGAVSDLLARIIEAVNQVLSGQPNSILARRSNNQFAIVVTQISLNEADRLAERLLGVCIKQGKVTLNLADDFFQLGGAYFRAGEPVQQLLDEADLALKAARLQGYSNWFMYDKGAVDEEFAKGSVRWRSILENALSSHRIIAYAQPVKDTDNQLHHLEMFSRVKDNQGHIIKATVFLPMANKCGLMPRIERQIIEYVLSHLAVKMPDSCFSINLSLDSLQSKNFIHWLTSYLLEHRYQLPRLAFEISEEIMSRHVDSFLPTLTMLKKMGVRICVDHVGLDVISTEYLKDLDVNFIKLHRSIIRQIHLRQENQLFVRSLLGGLYRTDIQVLAEGVEQFEEWQTLQILGVSAAQGRFLGEPTTI